MSAEQEPHSPISWDLGLALLYVLAIFVVGSLPTTPLVAQQVSDKLQHCVGFAVLAWIWCRALGKLRPGNGVRRNMIGGFWVSVAVGGALELWQALLSYRSCELLDWVADSVGALVGVGIYAGMQHVFGPRPRAAE
jgi:VanZ family protein